MILMIFLTVNLFGLKYRSPQNLIALYHEHGNAFERILFDSFINASPVMLTYKNGWVYIVHIPEMPEVGKKELYLNALILISGYKDESALTNFTESKYSEREERLNNEMQATSVLTTHELLSVSPFDFTYSKSSKSDTETLTAS